MCRIADAVEPRVHDGPVGGPGFEKHRLDAHRIDVDHKDWKQRRKAGTPRQSRGQSVLQRQAWTGIVDRGYCCL